MSSLSTDASFSVFKGTISINQIKEDARLCNKDPIVYLLTDCYDQTRKKRERKLTEQFLVEATKLTESLIDEEDERAKKDKDGSKYQWRIYTDKNGREMSLLHIVAERNLTSIAEILLKKYPNLLYLKSEYSDTSQYKEEGKLPVELAFIEEKNMDISAYLMSKMSLERVKYLFDDERNENGFELLADYAEAYSCADGQKVFADDSGSGILKIKFPKKQFASALKEVLEVLDFDNYSKKDKKNVNRESPEPHLREVLIVHAEKSHWDTAKLLKDLLSSDRQIFCHMSDVLRRSDLGETSEEKVKIALVTCPAVLLIWTDSLSERLAKEECISVEYPEFNIDCSLLKERQSKTLKIIPGPRNIDLSGKQDEVDGYHCEQLTFEEFLNGKKATHHSLQESDFAERVSQKLTKMTFNEKISTSPKS